MIEEITRNRLKAIRNPAFRAYARTYVTIYEEFLEAVGSTGVELEPADRHAEIEVRRRSLLEKGALFRNNGHSIYVNQISPACEACRHGMGSATFYISLKCHRHCFYCFNPNQLDYQADVLKRRDPAAELDALADQGYQLGYVALTGGEPLLYTREAVAFFQRARERFPMAHTRLYTAGDHLNRESLTDLQQAGLDEIRISVRAEDGVRGRRITYAKIALAREYLPVVMVETPVLPGTQEIMQEMLWELERLEIFGVNLLEFCYPYHHAEEYRQRSYRIRNRPYQTLYDYWYAGGLPVAGSEADCLALLEFMLDEKMKLGGHYCSLENKHTGQIFQQNAAAQIPATAVRSERDFFIKSAKVFGDDLPKVRQLLDRAGCDHYTVNRQHNWLEFHPLHVVHLRPLEVEVGICTHVAEEREGESVLRELKVALTTPKRFQPNLDL